MKKENQREKMEISRLLSEIFIGLGFIQILLMTLGILSETSRPFYRVYLYLSLGTWISFILAFVFFRWHRQLAKGIKQENKIK